MVEFAGQSDDAGTLPFSNRLDDAAELSGELALPGGGSDGADELLADGVGGAPLGGAIFASIDGKAGHHAPSIAIRSDGSLLAAWYSYVGPAELRGAEIYAANLATAPGDEQREWSSPRRVVGGPVAVGNPVLFAEGERVRMFYATTPGGWSISNIRQTVSDDGGETWGAARGVSDLIGANVRNPPVRASDGSLLLPAYDDLLQRALFFRSRDGEAWSLESAIETAWPARIIQPAVVSAGGTRMILAGRNVGGGGTWIGASEDNGRKWRISLEDAIPNPGSAVALAAIAEDQYVIVFNNSRENRKSLAAALAIHGGVSWFAPRTIVEGEGEYAYPAVAVDAAGVVHLVFSDDRKTIGYRRFSAGWLLGR